MDFNSLEEMVRYIESKSSETNRLLADEMVDTAKEITKENQEEYEPSTYVRTGKLIECIKPTIVTNDTVEIEWGNTGWLSYDKKKYIYAPGALENGTTYGKGGYRPATNFVDETYDELEDKIPLKYKKLMKSKGVPIE